MPPRPRPSINTQLHPPLAPITSTSSQSTQHSTYLSPKPPLLQLPYPLPIIGFLDISYTIRHFAIHPTPILLLILSGIRVIVLAGFLGCSKRWRRRGGFLGAICGISVGAIVWLGCVEQLQNGVKRDLFGGDDGDNDNEIFERRSRNFFYICTVAISIIEYLTFLLLLRLSPIPRTHPFILRPPPIPTGQTSSSSPSPLRRGVLKSPSTGKYYHGASSSGSPLRPRDRDRSRSRNGTTTSGDRRNNRGKGHMRYDSRGSVLSSLVPITREVQDSRTVSPSSVVGQTQGNESGIDGSVDESQRQDLLRVPSNQVFGGIYLDGQGSSSQGVLYGTSSTPAGDDDQYSDEDYDPNNEENQDEDEEEDSDHEYYVDNENEYEGHQIECTYSHQNDDNYIDDDETNFENEDNDENDEDGSDFETSSIASSISASSIIDLPPPLQPSRIIPSVGFNKGINNLNINLNLDKSPVFGPLVSRSKSARFSSRNSGIQVHGHGHGLGQGQGNVDHDVSASTNPHSNTNFQVMGISPRGASPGAHDGYGTFGLV